MKTLKLALIVTISWFGFSPLSAEELPKEEYLKEVNKAFRQIYEETNGKTLSAQIEILEALSIEYEDNPLVLNLLQQERGTIYSFMGQHQEALYAFDQNNPSPDTLDNAVKKLKVRDAVTAISETVGKHQIVMINEAHHVPQHRVLTYRLLEDLWDQGFRYLALEALSPNAEHNLPTDYVDTTAGFYTEEPIFANLVLRARQIGFHLVSYDYGSDTGTEARERSAVKNLREKVFNSNPDAKMLIHVGYSHINETSWLAHYLSEALHIDPLTINQTDFIEGSHIEHEPAIYTWLIDNHDFSAPVVLTTTNSAYWSPTPEEYDVTVVWPRTEYQLNRPDWASLGRTLLPVDISWCNQSFPCTIETYRFGNDDEVPADRIVVTASDVPTGIFISESDSYIIKVTDSEGKILHTTAR